MENKVLIAYASKYGSTKEVSEEIGKVFSSAGMEVDIIPMRKVKDVSRYTFAVLGTSIRMGKPLKEAVTFVDRYRDELKKNTVALFSVGLQMKEDTEENRTKAKGFLRPLLETIGEPVSIGLFGGSVDYKKFGLFLRFFAKKEKTGILHEGDWRNWEEIRKWAKSLIIK
jgi:menaquinone-dependent protoporphyrinogen oxidase